MTWGWGGYRWKGVQKGEVRLLSAGLNAIWVKMKFDSNEEGQTQNSGWPGSLRISLIHLGENRLFFEHSIFFKCGKLAYTRVL